MKKKMLLLLAVLGFLGTMAVGLRSYAGPDGTSFCDGDGIIYECPGNID